MRIRDLAKELGLSSKEAIEKLAALGVEAKSHMCAVEPAAEELLRAECKKTQPGHPAGRPAAEKRAPARHEHRGRAPAAAARKPAAKEPAKPAPAPAQPPPPPAPQPLPGPAEAKTLSLKSPIVVRDLAEHLGIKPNQLISELMAMNIFAAINQRVDIKIARQIAEKHGVVIEHEKRSAEHKPPPSKKDDVDKDIPDRPEELMPRPPIVTFMGHIDHGKTSILDRIRNANVAAREAGGITQHIGAYSIERNGKTITFIDTPGHEAFTAMRARGANITDIAVIIIAADDGIMPQTEEAISHAQSAGTTIMVAINKMDLPSADPNKVKKQLQAIGLSPEEWGGQTISCEVSALTGKGIDHLLEMILLQAEILDLKANPSRRAKGFVLESRLEAGRGPVVNAIVMNGSLKIGDFVVCGAHCGRIKALINEHGIQLRTVGPGLPAQCMGLSGVPRAGEEFAVYTDEKAARTLTQERADAERAGQITTPKKASIEDFLAQAQTNKPMELRLILKCDTHGSLEAVQKSLVDINSQKVSVSVILAAVGNITANDVLLASASKAIIAGFNVGKEPDAAKIEKREGVEIRLYAIIYKLIEQIMAAMSGMLAPEVRERAIGKAQVRQIFSVMRKGQVAGCMVIEGKINVRAKIRVKRQGNTMFEGSVMTLKHFRETVNEMREGQECGLRLNGFDAFELGDEIEFFEVDKIPQKI